MGQTTFSGPVKSNNGFIDPTDQSNARVYCICSEEFAENFAEEAIMNIPEGLTVCGVVFETITAGTAGIEVGFVDENSDAVIGDSPGASVASIRTAWAADPIIGEDQVALYGSFSNGVNDGPGRYRLHLELLEDKS